MRVLAFSDYRIQDVDVLLDFVQRMDKKPDLILYGGDDIDRFGPLPNQSIRGLVNRDRNRMIERFRRNGREVELAKFENELWLFCARKSCRDLSDKVRKEIERYQELNFGTIPEAEDYLCEKVETGKYVVGAIHFPSEKRNLFALLAEHSTYGLCAVIGNDDCGFTRERITGKNVFDVQKEPHEIGDYVVLGIEGAITDPGDPTLGIGLTLYTEGELREYLSRMVERYPDKKLIVLSHCPPNSVLDLAVRFGVRNIGSKVLREFIESNSDRIPLVVCGHVHLQGGKQHMLGKTLVVNAASHDTNNAPGRISIMELGDDQVTDVVWHQLTELTGIYGIGPARYQKLKDAGISTLDDVIRAGPECFMLTLGCKPQSAQNYYTRAQASHQNKVIVLGRVEPPSDSAIYLDIETDLAQSYVWLVGVLFEKTGELVQLVAEDPKKESLMLKQFVERMSGLEGMFYTFSGTKFDERVLRSRLVACDLETSALPQFNDVYHQIAEAVAFPMKSYGLKSIASYFGFEYRHPDLDGFAVALEYQINYLKNQDKELMRKLLEYNEDDIRSLPWILKRLSAITHGPTP
ncbi:MAG: TM0106 family RecB-like putative nuclease [Nitrososphaerales archaeon]